MGYFNPGNGGNWFIIHCFLNYPLINERLQISGTLKYGGQRYFSALSGLSNGRMGKPGDQSTIGMGLVEKMGNRLFAQDVVHGLFEWREDQWQPW